MVTVQYYADAVVLAGEAFPDESSVTPVSLLDGTYGLLTVHSRYDFLAREWNTLSTGLGRVDVISGQTGGEMPLTALPVGEVANFNLAQLAGGGFVESGLLYPASGTAARAVFQMMAADGTALGGVHRIGSADVIMSAPQTVVPLPTGGFVVSWNQFDWAQADTQWDAAFQVFDKRGHAVGAVVQIAVPGDQYPPEVALLSGLQLVATWTEGLDNWALHGQVFGLDGKPAGGVFTLVTDPRNYASSHSLVACGDGSFAVMWTRESDNLDTNERTTTYALQRFSATGAALTDEVHFVSLTVGEGGTESLLHPQMIALEDGRIAVAWTESQEAPPFNDMGRQFYTWCLMRIYEADGTEASPVYSLGADDGLEAQISIRALPDGRIAAEWQRYNPATSATDAVTQIFDSRSDGVDVTGNALANQYAGSSFADVLKGLAGDDTLFGNAGNDGVFGGTGDDLLLGGLGNDRLSGGDGSDVLTGFDGVDRLTGGKGSDLMFGGRGADVFVFAPGDGADRIRGFTDGQDLLDLSAWGFGSAAAAMRHFAAVEGGLGFSAGSDGVLIAGLALSDLNGADLILS